MRRVFLILAGWVATAASATEANFSETVIEAGFIVEQPVLVANLSDDGSQHIVLAGRDEDHQQRLAVFPVQHDGSAIAEPLLAMAPGPNLIAYDVGKLGDSDALFFVEPGRILRYDFATDEFVEVVKIRTIYGQERTGEIIPIDFFRDVNDDERDDLVVPDIEGYRVRLQHPDGKLGGEVVLQESSSMTVSGGNVSFQSRPLFSGDMNFDGLTDLAVWRGNSLRIYPQIPGAVFQSEPLIFALGLGLPTEAEIRTQQTNRGAVSQRGLTEKRIWLIEDLNNDNLPDILTESTLSQGVFDKQNDFRLHLGRREGDQLAYDETEDALLASEGLQYSLITTDIDGDGKQDLLVRQIRLTLGRVIRAMLSGNVSLRLSFFKMTDDSTFAEDANYVTKTNVRFSMKSGQVDIPAVQIADFDADGIQDLMMQTRPDRLSFYGGIPEDGLFAKEPGELEVLLPRNGDLVTAEDIDGDDRADLIIRYNAADGDDSSRTVRLLLATDGK